MSKELTGFRIDLGNKRLYLLADNKESAKREAMKRILDYDIPTDVLWTNSKERAIWDGMTVINFKLIDIRIKT